MLRTINIPVANVAPLDPEPPVTAMRTMPSTVRSWITTETVPVTTAPSPSPRVVRLPLSATSSGLGGATSTYGCT